MYIEEFPENDFPRGMQFSIIALGVAGLIGYTIVVKTNYSLWVDGAKLLLGISLMMYSFWRWMTPYVQLKTHSLQIFQSPFKFTRLRFQEISSIVLPTQQPHIFELVTKTGDTHKIKSRMIKRKLRADFLNTMDDLRRSLIRA